MMKVISVTRLSQEALDCFTNEGETFDGLAYLGVSPCHVDRTPVKVFGEVYSVPKFVIVNTDLLTQDRINLIDRLEDDLNGKDGRTLQDNDYYTYMRSIDEFNLSDDDSFFDYGNSFVTIIAYEVMKCIS